MLFANLYHWPSSGNVRIFSFNHLNLVGGEKRDR